MGETNSPPPARQASASGGLLVLGGAGFLGRHVTRRALVAEAQDDGPVWVASRDPSAAIHESLLPRHVKSLEVDATHGDALERMLDEVAPTRIVNCAALPSIERCNVDPTLADKLNAGLPERLARWAVERGVRLVHVSTDLVFDGEPPHPNGYREEDPAEPCSEYGRSKLRGEVAVLELHPGAVVARVPLLYGDSHGTGHGASDSLLAALEAGRTPSLFVDEWRSPLDVDNAACALLELSVRPELRGRLHLAGPDRLTRYDLGLLVLTARGLSAMQAAKLLRGTTRAAAGAEAERPRNVCLDARVARATLDTELHAVTELLATQRSA